jgi:site-specific recombinase XerD
MATPRLASSTWIVTPDKFLNPTQVAQLRAYLDAERKSNDRNAVRNAALLETLLGTGLRVSEVCALVVGDLFLDVGAANVLVRKGKGGKARLVAISEQFAAYLRLFVEWKRENKEPMTGTSPLFLSERSAAMSRSAVHRVWKAALEAATLPTRWGVHATRHSYAVEVYRKTRDLRLTQRLLGHSSPVVTTVYANLLDDDIRRGVEQIWAT